jgi:hypothetical protein
MKKIIVLATLALLTAGQAMAQQAPNTSSNQGKSQSQVEEMHEGNGSNHSN